MGLDQFAYVRATEKATKHSNREIAYWRKHPNLHGWMENIYRSRGGDAEMFNGVELELTREDLDQLEQAILEHKLPATQGFFFGNDSDDYYKDTDLKFIREARADIFCGLKVYYNSSW